MYAKHYQTGETIPDSLIEKILNQKTFNQGFMTTELLAAAILDMNLHNLTDTKNLDVLAYEKEAMNQLNLIPEISPALSYHLLQSYHWWLCCRLLQLFMGKRIG